MNRVVRHWWTRRCGVREVLVLSLPLVISTSSWTLMNFIDRMFLMWHSKEELAAAMPAGMMYFTLVCIPMGIALYVNTFVAQYHGAGRNERIGPVVWLGAMIAAGSTPLFFLTIPIVPQLFVIAGHAHDVARLEATYFQVLTFGAGGAVMCAALSTFFTGRGETSVVMYANITQSVLNIVLDYLWIFGHAGFPEMGIAGAGWATIVSIWVKAAIYAVLIRRPRYWTAYGFANGWRAEWQQFLRLLKYGGPSGLQMAVDCSAFTIFIMFVGLLGTDALAASTLAFNVNSVAFIPMIGLSIAVTTLVGRNQGAKRPRLSTRAAWTGFCLAGRLHGNVCCPLCNCSRSIPHRAFDGFGPRTVFRRACGGTGVSTIRGCVRRFQRDVDHICRRYQGSGRHTLHPEDVDRHVDHADRTQLVCHFDPRTRSPRLVVDSHRMDDGRGDDLPVSILRWQMAYDVGDRAGHN